MADPLSILRIISFVHELTQSIFTIRQFCEDVKDAPDEILELSGQIEYMRDVMELLTQDLFVNLEPTDVPKRLGDDLGCCRKHLERLECILKKLQSYIGGGRFATAVQMTFKKKVIDGLMAKFDGTKTELQRKFSLFDTLIRRCTARKQLQAMQELVIENRSAHAAILHSVSLPAIAYCAANSGGDQHLHVRNEGRVVRRRPDEVRRNLRFHLP